MPKFERSRLNKVFTSLRYDRSNLRLKTPNKAPWRGCEMVSALLIAGLLLVLFVAYLVGTDSKEQEFSEFEMVLVKSLDKKSDFYIGKYQVTQSQWEAVMGDNPSYFKGDNRPVDSVSWEDIQVFLKKLNQESGKSYRLPTEAEWEYAARGGNQSRGYTYAGSNRLGLVAWHRSNFDTHHGYTHDVGQKKPNELGLYDMLGNVAEWTSTGENDSYILRGGSWFCSREYCSLSKKEQFYASGRRNTFGFRLAHDFKIK